MAAQLLVACSVAALAIFASAHAQQDYRIGALLDTEDPFDAQRLDAMQAAVNEFNGTQGTNGIRLILQLYEMDHGSALEALRDAHASGAGPSIYLGPTYSGDVESVLDYVEDNSLVLISPSSSASALAVAGDGVFRLTAPVRLEADTLADLVYKSGAKTAVVAVQNDAFGKSVSDDMKQALDRYGIAAKDFVEFSADGSDWQIALERLDVALSSSGSDVALLVLAGFDSDIDAMVALASGYDSVISANWFVPSSAIYPVEGGTAPEISITTLVIEAGGNPTSAKVDSLMRIAGKEPSVYDYSAYDSVFVAGIAIETAYGSDLRSRVPAAALSLSGALGDISLDVAGDLSSPVRYGVWKSADGIWSRSEQYDAGVCPVQFVQILKNLDGAIACVKLGTAGILEARGWGIQFSTIEEQRSDMVSEFMALPETAAFVEKHPDYESRLDDFGFDYGFRLSTPGDENSLQIDVNKETNERTITYNCTAPDGSFDAYMGDDLAARIPAMCS